MKTTDSTALETVQLSLREIVGRDYAVENADGRRVFGRTSQLYGALTEGEIRTRLKVTDIGPQDLAVVTLVVNSPKHYFRRQKERASDVQEEVKSMCASPSPSSQ